MRRRKIEVWGGEGWTVKQYAWRGPCIKSPISHANMRGVVAVDESGCFRPGVRNWEWHTPDRVHKTIYEPYAKFRNKQDAIRQAKGMVESTMAKHQDDLETIMEDTNLRKRMQTAAKKYGFPFHIQSHRQEQKLKKR